MVQYHAIVMLPYSIYLVITGEQTWRNLTSSFGQYLRRCFEARSRSNNKVLNSGLVHDSTAPCVPQVVMEVVIRISRQPNGSDENQLWRSSIHASLTCLHYRRTKPGGVWSQNFRNWGIFDATKLELYTCKLEPLSSAFNISSQLISMCGWF
jgi:hypothetical protein